MADELGPISILVNNAAYNVMAPIWDYDPDDWDRVMATNVDGPWYLSKVAMVQMREAGGGSIVNISTVAPDCGGMGLEGPYAVSKGGLNVLTRSCAHEGGPYGIRCNTVTMGLVRGTRFTDVHHPEMVPERGGGRPAGRAAARRRHRRSRRVPRRRPRPIHHRRDAQRRRRRVHAVLAAAPDATAKGST